MNKLMAHNNGTDLFFLTGNYNKFLEIKAFIPALKQLDIDLEEIQSLSANDIIQAKLNEASKYYQAEFIVEDTSLYLDCLNGLPGPLIKWFLQALGCEGLFQMAKKLGNTKATARTIIGYRAGNGNILFFEGSLAGSICAPRGNNGFGWDQIFMLLPGSKNTVKMGIGVQQNREQEYSKNGNKNTVISINIINQGLHCIINKKQDCDGLKNKITYHYVSRDSQAS